MKNRFFLILFMLFLFSNLFTQNDWDLFLPNQISWWAQGNKVQLHYADSVAINTDNKEYFFGAKYIRNEFDTCYDSVRELIDTQIEPVPWNYVRLKSITTIIAEDNYWYQTNINGDTAYFYPLANPDDSWSIPSALNAVDSFKITCEMLTEKSFLNITDSVKEFSIQAFKDGQPITHEFNNATFQLSQHYGFIAFPLITSMIEPLHHFYNEPYESYKILGFKNSTEEHGFLNSFEDYFGNFKANDVYFYESHVSAYLDMLFFADTYIWDSIKQVTITTDSVIVLMDTYMERITQDWEPLDTNYYFIEDNIRKYSKDFYNTAFQKLTQTYIRNGDIHAPYIDEYGNIVDITSYVGLRIDSTCNLQASWGEGDPGSYDERIVCQQNVGKIYFDVMAMRYSDIWPSLIPKVYLSCYKQSETWYGEECYPFPYDKFFPSPMIPSENNIPAFSIGPNPSINNITVNIHPDTFAMQSDQVTVRVFDFHAKELFNQSMTNSEMAINTFSFPKGVYFIEINIGGKRKIHRFVRL